MRSATTTAVLCLTLSAAVGACGGGSSDRGAEQGDRGCEKLAAEPQREACERAEAAGRIPAADRVSYYALATTAGLLRANAVAASRSSPAPARAGGAELAAARGRLERTRPRDAGLRGLVPRELRLLRREAAGVDPGEADRVLVALGRIDSALSRYLRHRQPAQAALVPD